MQQVKKQLQDAIAELKSGWGINEVKREDLAAVLEKVVAALDRAAQLPVAPMPSTPGFDLGFLRVLVVDNSQAQPTEGNGNSSCFPAVSVNGLGETPVRTGFFDFKSRNFYETDYQGRTLDELASGRVFYNRKDFFRIEQDESGRSYVLVGLFGDPIDGNDVKEDIDSYDWFF